MIKLNQQIKGVLFLVIAALLWASINVILKYIAGRNLNPMVIGCTLYISALFVLIPVSFLLWLRSGRTASSYWTIHRPSLVVGIAKAVETLGFIGAVAFISATRATLLTKLNSVWTYLILVVFYRKKVRPVSVLGTVLSVSGVYMLLVGKVGSGTTNINMIWGSLLAVLSGLAFAVFSVTLEKDPSTQQTQDLVQRLRLTSYFLSTALLFLLPFGIIFLSTSLPSFSDFLWIFFAGGILTGMTYFLYYSALIHVSSLLAVVMLSFIIVFTLILEQLFLGISVLDLSFAIGAVLIISGVIFIFKDRYFVNASL